MQYSAETYSIEPIVKWAGGKRQIVYRLISSLPKKWERYFEPFLGGGALTAELYRLGRINSAVLSDKNQDIYNLMITVRDHTDDLINEIKRIPYENKKESYYSARSVFNSIVQFPSVKRAALFIYLNRHCFNGLYRLNSKGEFNVPFGSYRNPQYPPIELLRSWSTLLKSVELKICDFQEATSAARMGDFVYFDPPYFPISSTSNFTNYSGDGFSSSEQMRLADEMKRLDSIGAYVMLSNSDTPETRALYSGFNIDFIETNRNINSDPQKRHSGREIIVRNYW